MTASLEMLQKKLFGSERYPSDVVCHLYTPAPSFRCHFIIQVHVHWIHEYDNEANDDVPKPAQIFGTLVPRQKVYSYWA